MLSFNQLYLKAQKYASDTQNTQFFKDTINAYEKILENELDNFVVEETRTGSTIAGFNFIPNPENLLRFKFLYVVNGTIRYDAAPMYSEDRWQELLQNPTISTNYIQYCFPRRDYIEIFPLPSSILTYTLMYVASGADMQYDDYSIGTITSITSTAPLLALPYATVVGSGTAWTANMAGRYFQMTGDKQWYKITSVTDATHLVLSKAYAGIAISGLPNTTYTIAEMPRIPEAMHMTLYYAAMAEYYEGPKKDSANAKYFRGLYDKWAAWGKSTFSSRTEMGVIPSQRGRGSFSRRNPNLFPTNLT